ncbi:MAG: NADP oxidoreductase [Paludibacterium sp.]|uniref:NADH-quinone oxidoreductase subunit B family protein n=1 Tax=Paludibacterium sp. TaxID=1917523 RepID=UPI0025D0CA7A|nr:NADP oxidoreductase [Paludibacterium sp.]MBV8046492.1 NADP oxidoreductase [Paludibacterium sp.]MBV8646554.1 NADP oxidoreductase [Paludibacterium sp.]
MTKPTIATCSLAGCFGCHMSLLDIDERIVDLVQLVQFDRSPLTDIKHCSEQGVDIGLIEGALCNAENIHTLREFRRRCRILVAVGTCAISGGVPALRNRIPVEECLNEAYLQGQGIDQPQIPNDVELPLLMDKVYPVHEVVHIDYSLPGCPPPADAFWSLLTALLEGREPSLDYPLRRFD